MKLPTDLEQRQETLVIFFLQSTLHTYKYRNIILNNIKLLERFLQKINDFYHQFTEWTQFLLPRKGAFEAAIRRSQVRCLFIFSNVKQFVRWNHCRKYPFRWEFSISRKSIPITSKAHLPNSQNFYFNLLRIQLWIPLRKSNKWNFHFHCQCQLIKARERAVFFPNPSDLILLIGTLSGIISEATSNFHKWHEID